MLNFCNIIFIHKCFGYTALILLFDFFQQIYHGFKNQELTNFDLVLQSFILCWFFSKTIILNTIILMLYQLLPHHCYLLHNKI